MSSLLPWSTTFFVHQLLWSHPLVSCRYPFLPVRLDNHHHLSLRTEQWKALGTGHGTGPWTLSICGWSSVELDRIQRHGYWYRVWFEATGPLALTHEHGYGWPEDGGNERFATSLTKHVYPVLWRLRLRSI
ncbi:uncharacterized protein CC84DRAFT_134491 [Paraphaeosphaeria sporulosa]|uniref:Uncharacterized protein n=1 Tax=Paraphaeosphaeria sporulosa TaxID=1460663 RepID=A0A177CZT3_9PLEO|nr:uncharacterized protein CC84DRAFT_134491 [Paraphaeosphaeria sporulosa]OAG12641.1 hypothetical protein CC84DRAFT_134491 [Paraphaeosphaeria sporulosa]